MNAPGWKGVWKMYSICIKFKDQLGWRPMCRQFEDENSCHSFVNEAFDKWPVKHVSVFLDGKFITCFFMSPRLCGAIRASVEALRRKNQRLYGNYSFR